jgi:iron complex transport system ATP-binding protein
VSALVELRNVRMHYGTREVLRGITTEFSRNHLVAIAGPNGAGKSTLLNVIAGLRREHKGECFIAGNDVRHWSRKALARSVAVVPQILRIEFPFTVEQIVLMGRAPFCDGMFESDADRAEVDRAMDLTDTREFRHRDFRSLSGGERQRVILASALAQSPEVLLLDEPTTFLDLKHQLALYRLLQKLCSEGLLVIAVTHDLNLASAFADRIVLLKDGQIAADAPSLSADMIRSVFEVDVVIDAGPQGRPWIQYGW